MSVWTSKEKYLISLFSFSSLSFSPSFCNSAFDYISFISTLSLYSFSYFFPSSVPLLFCFHNFLYRNLHLYLLHHFHLLVKLSSEFLYVPLVFFSYVHLQWWMHFVCNFDMNDVAIRYPFVHHSRHKSEREESVVFVSALGSPLFISSLIFRSIRILIWSFRSSSTW